MKLVVASIAALLTFAAPGVALARTGGEPGSIGLDPRFGDSGTALMPVADDGDPPSGSGASFAAARDIRGGFVLGGRVAFRGGSLVRFGANGGFDRSFGKGGFTAPEGARASTVGALAVDVFGGFIASSLPRPTPFLPQRLALTRYTSVGDLDPSFGGTGVASVEVPAEVGNMAEGIRGKARSIAIDDRDRITVAWVKTNRASSRRGTGFVIARFDRFGMPDERFGRGGLFTAQLPHTTPFKLAYAGTDATGERVIIVATTFLSVGGSRRHEVRIFEVTRLLLDGTPDPSFGRGDGVVRTIVGPRGTTATVAALDSKGRLVIGGVNERGFGFTRLLRDGRLDPNFNSDGGVAIPASRRLGAPDLRAIAIDSRDRIVVSGRAAISGVNDDDFFGLRLRTDGKLDRDFGRVGTCVASFPAHQAYSTAATPAGDGDVVLSGVAERPDPDVYPPTVNRDQIVALAKCAG